jgi:hypothetical protein
MAFGMSKFSDHMWVWIDAAYLREQALRCARLARECPHRPTSHELEAIGVEFMEKAAELDALNEGTTPSR